MWPLTAQFYALLLRLLHEDQFNQRGCENTEGNELTFCLNTLTYRQDHVVRYVGQAINKRIGKNVQNVTKRALRDHHAEKMPGPAW